MITVTELSPEEVSALAFVVEKHRIRSGCETWDRRGIIAQLAKIDGNVPTSLAAALAAAEDPAARTPAAMVFDKYRPAALGEPPLMGAKCDVCGRSRTVHDRMAQLTGDSHAFVTEPPPRSVIMRDRVCIDPQQQEASPDGGI